MEAQKINNNSNVILRPSKYDTQAPLLSSFKNLKIALGILMLLVSVTALQAQKIWENRKGCFRSQGNLAGGYLFQAKQVSAYLTGDMDLFIDNRVSIAGSAWYSFATSRKNQPGIKMNHAILGGLSYHFTKKGRFDPYIGLTPGVGMVQAQYHQADLTRVSPISAVPLVSAYAGFNYYIGSVFHFFGRVQGVTGQLMQHLPSPARLEEIKITAGLGWNFRLWKPKNKDDNKVPVLFK